VRRGTAVLLAAFVAAGLSAVIAWWGLAFVLILVGVVACSILNAHEDGARLTVSARDAGGWQGDLRVRTEPGVAPGTRVMVVLVDGVEVERSPELLGAEELSRWSRDESAYLQIERATA